jgi:FKBP-type peptidyl-prolyl cis-trans isomerase FkpA
MKNLLIFGLVVISLSCQPQQSTFTTESGVLVTKIENGKGSIPTKDSILILQMKLVTDSGEVITETTPIRPLALKYDPAMEAGALQEVVTKLTVGDSVSFTLSAKNLFEETYKRPVPPTMDSTTVITCNMLLQDQMTQDGYRAYTSELREQQRLLDEAKLADKLISDGETIDAYLAENGIEAITTESGLRYVITEEGNGPTAESGNEVVVHYAGKILEGAYFDTSMEEVAQEQGMFNPSRDYASGFKFNIGQGRVIKGWDEGIAYIKEGGKGTLYIPSPLGYGSRGSGPKIPPYSILVFDVEVLKVNK